MFFETVREGAAHLPFLQGGRPERALYLMERVQPPDPDRQKEQ